MKPAAPSGTILAECPAEPNEAVKELWGGDIPELIPLPPADDGVTVEAGQQLVKMMLKEPSAQLRPRSNASSAASEAPPPKVVADDDEEDLDEEQALDDIE